MTAWLTLAAICGLFRFTRAAWICVGLAAACGWQPPHHPNTEQARPMSTVFARSYILHRVDQLRASVHELSLPEICDRVARELHLSAETVQTIVNQRDAEHELAA